jgi:4-amino-4-deoxy-L-arabinose transferase-like glycosyltransferase
VLPVAVVVLLKVALGASVLGRYGWQRDELYYAVAARHLSFGYADFPPVTAFIGAGVRLVFGESRVALRAVALASGACVVVVCALIARELGGSRRAQTFAAAAVALTPSLLGTNTLFQPVSFDYLASAVFLWLAVRLALAPTRRLWVAIGIVLGVGLETKYTIGVLAVGLLLGAALFRRELLRVRDLGIALALALALAAPNLVWEARHQWATVRFLTNSGGSATSETRPQFVVDLIVLGGVLLPVWLAGFRSLRRDPRTRWLAWGIGIVCLAYFALGGKSYYAAPVLVLALAAGAPWVERRITSVRSAVVAAVIVLAVTLPVLPVAVPVLPAATMVRWHIEKVRSDYKDELGWSSVVDGAVRATAAIRSSGGVPGAVVAANYGEAGALDVLGKGRGLPPTMSGNLSYRYWRPARIRSNDVVVVGYDKVSLARYCTAYRVVTRVHIPYGVDNDESGQPIATCALRGGLDAVWPELLDPRF